MRVGSVVVSGVGRADKEILIPRVHTDTGYITIDD